MKRTKIEHFARAPTVKSIFWYVSRVQAIKILKFRAREALKSAPYTWNTQYASKKARLKSLQCEIQKILWAHALFVNLLLYFLCIMHALVYTIKSTARLNCTNV